MSDFFRFPHTPHLAWLGQDQPRDDKVLSPEEAEIFLQQEVVVEEKVDGANLGFSVNEDGELLAQNRGSYLTPQSCHPQFRPLWPWLKPKCERIAMELWPHLLLFGEWCLAVHSLHYTRLPDWFLGFDVYDREARTFWDSEARNALLDRLKFHAVPRVTRGRQSLDSLKRLLGSTRLGDGPAEGLVLRLESHGSTIGRAKLVHAAFTQGIETHWSKGALKRNKLAAGVTPWP
jgi:ATP-dependent RNA circularization protein (DNA/RNA ligase family)